MVAGNIPGLTQTASLAIYDAILQGNDAALRRPADLVDLRRLDRGAHRRPAHDARPEDLAVTGPSYDVLDVRLEHRVHAGLTIDVDFRLGREIGVIFGASGAGKTTILRLIAGLARPHSGRIQLGERDAVRLVASGRSSAAPSQDRDDLPGRPALPAPDRGRQHPVRTQGVATSGGRRPAGRGGRSLRRRTA